MFKQNSAKIIIYMIGLAFLVVSCSHAAPPKPGPDFVWVKAHTTPAGIVIHGHWKYVGPGIKGKAWVPGHYDKAGNWVAGHWKLLKAPAPKAVWVPGHHGPRGRWIPGHWR